MNCVGTWIPVKYLVMIILGHICINNLWKFEGIVCFYLIFSAVPKKEKMLP